MNGYGQLIDKLNETEYNGKFLNNEAFGTGTL